MALYFSKKYWLVTWQLASALSYALSGGSTCLPNVTFTGIYEEPIESRRDLAQLIEEQLQQPWIQFRVDGPFCGKRGQCCTTDVSVSQGAAIQTSRLPFLARYLERDLEGRVPRLASILWHIMPRVAVYAMFLSAWHCMSCNEAEACQQG
jgi:hypothetical protein